ncbi:MAG: efflux RND transporter periplasmic adaptor subunit [Akkermansiaceae bacterium]
MPNFIIRVVVSFALLFGAYELGQWLISGKEEPKGKKPVVVIPTVTTLRIDKSNHQPEVVSYGNVQSYFETNLTSEVEGKIILVSKNFRVGKMVQEGEVLAMIDDTDYQAALATQKANLILQERNLAEEEVRSQQASEDWVASGRKLTTASSYVLRKPQLAAAESNIDSAKAAVKKAEADLERTKIVAPYAAIVTERVAALGNFANDNTSLGRLVATEKAEVRVPLTAEQMNQVQFSDKEKTVLKLTMPSKSGLSWDAELSSLDPTIDTQNQVSYAIATVNDPYKSLEKTLPIGSFVNVALPAKEIKDAYKIPEAALVNDQFFWIVGEDDKLVKIEAERIQSSEGYAYVTAKSDLAGSEIQLVSRPLSTFRSGSQVQVEKDQEEVNQP